MEYPPKGAGTKTAPSGVAPDGEKVRRFLLTTRMQSAFLLTSRRKAVRYRCLGWAYGRRAYSRLGSTARLVGMSRKATRRRAARSRATSAATASAYTTRHGGAKTTVGRRSTRQRTNGGFALSVQQLTRGGGAGAMRAVVFKGYSPLGAAVCEVSTKRPLLGAFQQASMAALSDRRL
jgi:hypothetical protein